MKLLLVTALINLIILQYAKCEIVDVAQGKLEGSFDGSSRDGRTFHQFIGIQFAQIPGRFEVAIPPESWDGVKSAMEFGPGCRETPEDCLYLNVFTPKVYTENMTLLPTVVYIHGGSFEYNSNQEYGPNYLMDEDLVFVVIQYRLGVYGFLSTEDENAPGNLGLKDQVMALKWVEQNIKAFGGDKDRVTLMGQSAGSASVTYHLVAPMSKGLFQNAIAQSGTFLDPWAFTRNPRHYAERLAELVNCSTSTTKELVTCLKTTPTDVIASVKRNATIKWFEEPMSAFGPVIEPSGGNIEDTFLSKSPYQLLVEGNVAKVPLLTGVTQEEGIYIWAGYILYSDSASSVESAEDLRTNWSGVAPTAFYFDEVVPSDMKENVSMQIRDFYFGDEEVDKKTFYNLAHLYTDRLFVNSAVEFINLYAKHAPVYPYLYTFSKYVGIEFAAGGLLIDHPLEATHAAEMDNLVSPYFGQVRNETDHHEFSKLFVKLWTSFIETGVPTGTFGSATNFPSVDPQVGLEKWYKLDFETEVVNNDVFKERKAFWDSLPLNDNDFTVNANK